MSVYYLTLILGTQRYPHHNYNILCAKQQTVAIVKMPSYKYNINCWDILIL